jgi:hypothetical protein
MRTSFFLALIAIGTVVAAQQSPNPRQQPGGSITMFAPDQHDLYDGHFVMSAGRIHMVGGVNDPEGWDHMDNAAATVKPGRRHRGPRRQRSHQHREVRGPVEDSRGRSGPRHRSLQRIQPLPERRHRRLSARTRNRLGLWRQQLAEDVRLPGGWGFGHATLNGKPLYQDYEMHFMVTQGIRDRQTLKVNYPMAGKKGPAGEVNPAAQQIDFYIRSPQQNPKNKPNRQVFMHFFGMEVTWK